MLCFAYVNVYVKKAEGKKFSILILYLLLVGRYFRVVKTWTNPSCDSDDYYSVITVTAVRAKYNTTGTYNKLFFKALEVRFRVTVF